MTVKDILKLVCEFVDERDILSKWNSSTELSSSEQKKVDRMVKCFNLVNQEIASDYLPFLTEEAIDVSDGPLYFANLSKTVINVYEVRNAFGFSLHFKNFANHIKIDGHGKKVVYSYLPNELTLNQDVEKLRGLSERVYAYGVACEFLLLEGFGNDAELWEERFKEALFILSRKRGEHLLPERRFL